MLRKIKAGVKEWALDQKRRQRINKNFKRLTMCKKCYTFYYKNSWHFYKPADIEIDQNEEIPVRFTECSACLDQEFNSLEIDSNLAW